MMVHTIHIIINQFIINQGHFNHIYNKSIYYHWFQHCQVHQHPRPCPSYLHLRMFWNCEESIRIRVIRVIRGNFSSNFWHLLWFGLNPYNKAACLSVCLLSVWSFALSTILGRFQNYLHLRCPHGSGKV